MGTAVAVIALAVASVLMWKSKLPKIVALLTLVAGSGLSDGFLGRLLHKLAGWGVHLVGTFTDAAFGIAVPAALAVVALIVYVHDMWPRHSASRTTASIGLVLPMLVAYVGGAAGSLAGSGVHVISTAVGRALTALFGGA